MSFDDYWANLQTVTEPSLKPEVFLASREEQVKELARSGLMARRVQRRSKPGRQQKRSISWLPIAGTQSTQTCLQHAL